MSKAPARVLENVLARRIREVSDAKGLALSHVADRAGIARSHLWALLNAQRSPTLELLQRLSEALEVEPLTLLQGKPSRLPKRRRK